MTDVITITTPTAKLEFPGDTPTEQIRTAIGQYATTKEARESALNEWADQYVARERKGGGTWQTITDAVRNFAGGTPLGSWADEANAAIAAATGQAPYDEAKAYQNATDRAVERDTGATGTATKVAGGVASAVAAPVAHVVRGATMLPQAVNMAVTGGAYGGLYGAGEGDGLAERAKNAATGTAIGTGLGALSAPIAKGVSNAAGYVADKFKGMPAALSNYVPGAVSRVSRAVGDDVPVTAAIPARAAELGTEGMIADIGPNTRGQIGALARTPGEGQAVAMDRLNTRAEGASGRIKTDLDTALGPERNIPETLDAIDKHFSGLAKPKYEQFRQTPVPYTQDLEEVVNTLKNEPSVLREARRMANLDSSSGPNQFFAQIDPAGQVTINRVPNANEWDYIKRALDGLARSPEKNDQRIYGSLAKRVRDSVDNVLSPGNPADSIWAQGRALSGEGKSLGEALDNGRGAFSRGISPDEMLAEVKPMSAAERAAYNAGARQNVRDVMGNASTKWGANDDSAARKMLSTPYARDKLDILAGPPNARRLNDRIDTETAFDTTRDAAKGNSVTAAMQAAQKEFPSVANKTEIGREIGSQSLAGLTVRGVRAIVDAVSGGAVSERNAMIASDAVKMLTEQGATRDQIARALMDYRDSKGITQQGKDSIDRLTQILMQSPRQKVIDLATNR